VTPAEEVAFTEEMTEEEIESAIELASTNFHPEGHESLLNENCHRIIDKRIKSEAASNVFSDLVNPNPQPYIIALARCQTKTVDVTFMGTDYQLHKEDFGIVIVLIDFLVISIYLYFIHFLETKQDDFINEFKDQSIEMDDFAVEISPIPCDGFFKDNEHTLRAFLWEYVETVLIN